MYVSANADPRIPRYQKIEDVLFRKNDLLLFPDVSLSTKMSALYHIIYFRMSVCLDTDAVVVVVVVVVAVVVVVEESDTESDVVGVMDMPRDIKTH